MGDPILIREDHGAVARLTLNSPSSLNALSDEMLAEMLTFERPGFYGLGAYPATFAGNRGVGHRGGIRGYESAMFYFPEDGVTVVLLSNQGNWGTDAPMIKLVKAVLGSD